MTSGEHQMRRMGAEYTSDAGRPVPRIEFIHKPRRVVTGAGGVVLEDAPNPQPWHVRYIGGNGEPLAHSEQLTSPDACRTNAVAMARLFGGIPSIDRAFIDDKHTLIVEASDGISEHHVPILIVEDES